LNSPQHYSFCILSVPLCFVAELHANHTPNIAVGLTLRPYGFSPASPALHLFFVLNPS